jgi:hypothetical protein
MRIGDLFVWLAAACLAVAGYGFGGWRVALIVAAVCLVWFGQCYAHTPTPRLPRLRLPRRAKGEK